MKKARVGTLNLLMSIVEIAIGILLFINPVVFTSGIIIILGIVFAIMGIVQIIGYFRADAEEAAIGGKLTKGVLFIAFGLFCVFKSDWFMATFSVITTFYGILIFVAGVSKLQKTIDMARLKQKYWFIALINALLTLLFAIFILFNPFVSTAILWTFIGVTLIIEAVMDIATFICSKKS